MFVELNWYIYVINFIILYIFFSIFLVNVCYGLSVVFFVWDKKIKNNSFLKSSV